MKILWSALLHRATIKSSIKKRQFYIRSFAIDGLRRCTNSDEQFASEILIPLCFPLPWLPQLCDRHNNFILLWSLWCGSLQIVYFTAASKHNTSWWHHDCHMWNNYWITIFNFNGNYCEWVMRPFGIHQTRAMRNLFVRKWVPQFSIYYHSPWDNFYHLAINPMPKFERKIELWTRFFWLSDFKFWLCVQDRNN